MILRATKQAVFRAPEQEPQGHQHLLGHAPHYRQAAALQHHGAHKQNIDGGAGEGSTQHACPQARLACLQKPNRKPHLEVAGLDALVQVDAQQLKSDAQVAPATLMVTPNRAQLMS